MKIKLSDKLKGNEDISKQVILKSSEEDTSPRRIFSEDHKILRRLSYEREKTIVEVLGDILDYVQSKKFKTEAYEQYEKRESPSLLKSVKIPNDFYDFVKEQSKSYKIPALHILSFMVRDYEIHLEKGKEW